MCMLCLLSLPEAAAAALEAEDDQVAVKMSFGSFSTQYVVPNRGSTSAEEEGGGNTTLWNF